MSDSTRRPALIFRCRRCAKIVTEDCATPDVEIRRRIETGQLYTVHECSSAWGPHHGGALGVAELLGEGERPAQPMQGDAT
jgi:hypothetical protein